MKKDIKYALIVPLVGGMGIGLEKATNKLPEWIVSYDAFINNDKLLLDYYQSRGLDVPYHLIDASTNNLKDLPLSNLCKVDIVGALPPCAGLSQLNASTNTSSNSARGEDAIQNEWMYKSSRFVLENIKPKVLWGENAPNLFTGAGKKVRETLYAIAKENGYSFSLIKTSTLLHGVPQNRCRTFYFFWKSEFAPILNYYNRAHNGLSAYLKEIPIDATCQDFYYQDVKIIEEYPPFEYMLESSGLSYKEYLDSRENFSTMDDIIRGNKYLDLVDWYNTKYPEGGTNKQERVMAKLSRVYDKTCVRKAGGYWDSGPKYDKYNTNAIISKNASWFLHPEEPRILNGRELIHLMGFPHDFSLTKKNIHAITQNVPACTSADWSNEVIKFINGQLAYSESDFLMQNNISQKIYANDISINKNKVLF